MEHKVIWGGAANIVEITPSKFPKLSPRNSDNFYGGFVRLYDPEIATVCDIEMYLHGDNPSEVKQTLRAAKRGPILCSVKLARNTYNDGIVKFSLDFWPAPGSTAPTCRIRIANASERTNAVQQFYFSLDTLKAVFIAEYVRP